MDPKARYQINYPNVVAESFGSESVIVNLEKGTYFSLDEFATVLWNLICTHMALGAISTLLIQKFPQNQSEGTHEFKQFFEVLIEHQLIKEYSEGSVVREYVFPQIQYSKPVITVHNDLQDILLLDPVHDVNKEGWPVHLEEKKK